MSGSEKPSSNGSASSWSHTIIGGLLGALVPVVLGLIYIGEFKNRVSVAEENIAELKKSVSQVSEESKSSTARVESSVGALQQRVSATETLTAVITERLRNIEGTLVKQESLLSNIDTAVRDMKALLSNQPINPPVRRAQP